MTDIWVCSTCHSINRQRNDRCYKCGGPRSAATGEGSTLRVEQAMASRVAVRYRSAWLRGLIASLLILVVAGLGLILLALSFDDVAWVRDQLDSIVAGGTIDEAELLARVSESVPIGLARLGVLALAVTAFAAWLSRVVMNVPALGGGVPGTTPTRAFLYPLIPIWNLIKVPSIIQDALYRVDPRAGGFFMVALAWFGLVGSWIIGFVAGWAVDLKLIGDVAAAQTDGDLTAALRTAFDLYFGIEVVTSLMVVVGSLVLIGVMMRIERRSRARDAEIRVAALAPRAEPGSVEARPGAVTREEPRLATASRVDPPMPQRQDPVQQRPITAATGAASLGPAAGLGPAARDVPSVLHDARPEPAADPDVPATAEAGLRLSITVADDGRLIAELGGESEVVTVDALREAGVALARAGGSAAVIAGSSTESQRLAEEAAGVLRGVGVATSLHP